MCATVIFTSIVLTCTAVNSSFICNVVVNIVNNSRIFTINFGTSRILTSAVVTCKSVITSNFYK